MSHVLMCKILNNKMASSSLAFKSSLNSVLNEIEKLKVNPPNCKEYTLRIADIEQKFDRFYEEVTPKPVLSDVYTCVGRMKFYGDGMLFIYLEISENDRGPLPWPVRATWRVELLDENDYSNKEKIYKLGEATCLFNKPRQGFVSHPNDWISVKLDQIKYSGRISQDRSVTIRWSVITEPVLQDVYLEQFVELLKTTQKYFDCFHGDELKEIQNGVSAATEKSKEHEEKISSLQKLIPGINEKLDKIEIKQDSIDAHYKNIQSFLDNNINSKNHHSEPFKNSAL
ncbi:hypothetical protein Btru_048270 [Bulinus truncatus]|nr:hypothetical protein Btru_048270 [Bulinus truncatus]